MARYCLPWYRSVLVTLGMLSIQGVGDYADPGTSSYSYGIWERKSQTPHIAEQKNFKEGYSWTLFIHSVSRKLQRQSEPRVFYLPTYRHRYQIKTKISKPNFVILNFVANV